MISHKTKTANKKGKSHAVQLASYNGEIDEDNLWTTYFGSFPTLRDSQVDGCESFVDQETVNGKKQPPKQIPPK
jgi:hypothetical protein